MTRLDLLTANDFPGEYPGSFYASDKSPQPRSSAQDEIRADICVIGGGLTGVSAALSAAQKGASVVLLEASRIGFGASGRNGGQIGTGQRADQYVLERKYGKTRAQAMFQIGVDAHDYVLELCREHDLDIGYRPGVAHLGFTPSETKEEHAYASKLANEYGYDRMEPVDDTNIGDVIGSSVYHGGVIDWGAGHGDPLALVLGLARAAEAAGVVIFETSRVKSLDPVVTDQGAHIHADHVILACNGYLGDLDRETAKYVMPINNFIVATEKLEPERAHDLIPQNIAIADSKFVVNYFRRSDDDRLLFGGGESYGYRFPRDLAAKARTPMLQVFPQLDDVEVEYAWGGTLAITMNRLPYVRRRGALWVSGGYSGHGVSMATYMGKAMAQAIEGQSDEFDIMSQIPHKAFPGGARLRHAALVAGMLWYRSRDQLGW